MFLFEWIVVSVQEQVNNFKNALYGKFDQKVFVAILYKRLLAYCYTCSLVRYIPSAYHCWVRTLFGDGTFFG